MLHQRLKDGTHLSYVQWSRGVALVFQKKLMGRDGCIDVWSDGPKRIER